ncbi:MAG: tetratricopeptide repeat protein [Anaerolineae bacterium]|nr:tetratricopeptide repeat protein [Anaerolineae bacterium]
MANPEQEKSSRYAVDQSQNSPASAVSFSQAGWKFYLQKDYINAEENFRKALSLQDNDLDTYYALGLVLKAANKGDEAIAMFEKVLSLLDSLENQQRASMLKHITHAQINQIKSGKWNMEKEIWQKTN